MAKKSKMSKNKKLQTIRKEMNKDFTYCTGTGCPIKSLCKRYLAEPFSTHRWWMNAEYNDVIDKCINFIDK